jgi:hypothetical protein
MRMSRCLMLKTKALDILNNFETDQYQSIKLIVES